MVSCEKSSSTFAVGNFIKNFTNFIRIADFDGYRVRRFQSVQSEYILKIMNDELFQHSPRWFHLNILKILNSSYYRNNTMDFSNVLETSRRGALHIANLAIKIARCSERPR